MITSRLLPHKEWPKLKGTEAETVWPVLAPEGARVVVVEDDGVIVGTWIMMHVVQAECLWVAPSHRGVFGVVKRLLRGMTAVASEWGAAGVVTRSLEAEVTDLIRRFGGHPIPGDHYVLPVEMTPPRAAVEA